jgi:hypothetical protein
MQQNSKLNDDLFGDGTAYTPWAKAVYADRMPAALRRERASGL